MQKRHKLIFLAIIISAGEEENIKVSVQESGKGGNTFHSTGGAGDAGNGEDEEEDEEEDEYEDVDDEDDEDYEDILETIFEKRATLSAFEDYKWKVRGQLHVASFATGSLASEIISNFPGLSTTQLKGCQRVIKPQYLSH